MTNASMLRSSLALKPRFRESATGSPRTCMSDYPGQYECVAVQLFRGCKNKIYMGRSVKLLACYPKIFYEKYINRLIKALMSLLIIMLGLSKKFNNKKFIGKNRNFGKQYIYFSVFGDLVRKQIIGGCADAYPPTGSPAGEAVSQSPKNE